MKKNKMHFESKFWAAYEIGSHFEVMDAFFDYADLEYYKRRLDQAVLYIHSDELYEKDYPGEVFIFYTVVRSFLKACFCLQSKREKWKVKEPSDCKSILHQASLTKEEYADPLIVFQKAFAYKTLDEFEFFLAEVVHVSLCSSIDELGCDLMTPYIHLVKMLDAAQLIRERGIEKVKKLDSH